MWSLKVSGSQEEPSAVSHPVLSEITAAGNKQRTGDGAAGFEHLAIAHRYTPGEVLTIRNAFKLGSKFFDTHVIHFDERRLSLCEHSFDVGLTLILAGASSDVIAAGVLGTAFEVELKSSRTNVLQTISRKFGATVADLVEKSRPAEASKSLQEWYLTYLTSSFVHTGSSDVATLVCARKIDLLTSASTILESYPTKRKQKIALRQLLLGKKLADKSLTKIDSFAELFVTSLVATDELFKSRGVSPILLYQYREAAGQLIRRLGMSVPTQFADPSKKLVGETQDYEASLSLLAHLNFSREVNAAAAICNKHFEGVRRNWGPSETIPLSMHAMEVGTLLALAGCDRDVVIAGLLHDTFENYLPAETVKILRSEIKTRFGDRVHGIIESVSEPGKSEEGCSWAARKEAILSNLETHGSDVGSVLCAAKISTLAAGNKMRYELSEIQGSSSPSIAAWSKGSYEENVSLFAKYRTHFMNNGVPRLLMEQYNIEFGRFCGPVTPVHQDGDGDTAVNSSRAG